MKITEKLFKRILEISGTVELTYDVKVLTITLSTLLMKPDLPACLDKSRGEILFTIIFLLDRQIIRDSKILLKSSNEDLSEECKEEDAQEEQEMEDNES